MLAFALLTSPQLYSVNDVLVVYCCSFVIQSISCKWQIDEILSFALTSTFYLPVTHNIRISPCLMLVTKNNPFSASIQPTERNENYLQHLSILFPPPPLVSTSKNPKFITKSAKLLTRPKLTVSPTQLIVPLRAESDILINCNNFTQTFQCSDTQILVVLKPVKLTSNLVSSSACFS